MTQQDLTDGATDAELVAGLRAGDGRALAVLHARHSADALRVARIVTHGRDAEDLAADAFLRVVDQIVSGRGPQTSFRGYLHTVIRNLHGERSRRAAREHAASDKPWLLDTVDGDDGSSLFDELDAHRAARALRTLPDSWRSLLWELEVKGRKPAEVAADLEVPAATVSSTAYRAREGLRLAYLDEHVAGATDRHCDWTRRHLGRLVRGTLRPRTENKVRAHLDDCRECALLHADLDQLNTRLGAAIWPVLLVGLTTTGGIVTIPDTGDGTPKNSRLPRPSVRAMAGAAAAVAIVVAAVAAALAGSSDPAESSTVASPVAEGPGQPVLVPPVEKPAVPAASASPSMANVVAPATVVPAAPPAPAPPPPGPADLQVGAPTVEATGAPDRYLLTVPLLAAGATPATGFTINLTITMAQPTAFVERASAGWACGPIEAGDANGDPFYFDTVTCSYTYEPGQPVAPFELVVESLLGTPAGSVTVEGVGNADPDSTNDTRSF